MLYRIVAMEVEASFLENRQLNEYAYNYELVRMLIADFIASIDYSRVLDLFGRKGEMLFPWINGIFELTSNLLEKKRKKSQLE